MDNLTHTLTAVAISQAGLNRKTRFATVTLILAANAPDIDIVTGFKSGLCYLHDHRGITHSLVGIFGITAVVWGLVILLGRKARPKPGLPLRRRWLLLAALLGTGSHLLLDFTNAYGVRPFLPFSGRWYAWDIMPIFDPLLLALFVLGLAVPWVLRMVSEEVGERGARKVNGAVFCLVTMALLWGIRDVAHRRAVNILDGRLYSDELPQSVGAFPVMVNPFNWVGVVETESAFHVMRVNTLSANPLPEEAETFQKPQSSPALRAALETPAARIFLDFARFPWAQVEEDEDGYEVSVSDLRFFHPGAQVRGFTLEVNLNKALRTQSAKFFFVAPRPK